jgi:hypothetical protein
MSTEFRDSEKAALQAYVQRGDRDLDPTQADAWAANGTFQIGDLPAVTGPDAIRGFLAGFFQQGMFKTVRHEIVDLLEQSERAAFRANAHFTLQNGESLSVPYATFLGYGRERGALKFDSYRVYIDFTPVARRAAEIQSAAQ